MMNWYLGISGLLFVFLFLVWSGKGWQNFLLKAAFFLMAAWSTVLNLAAVGWIVKG